jgi:hypothetical protein
VLWSCVLQCSGLASGEFVSDVRARWRGSLPFTMSTMHGHMNIKCRGYLSE